MARICVLRPRYRFFIDRCYSVSWRFAKPLQRVERRRAVRATNHAPGLAQLFYRQSLRVMTFGALSKHDLSDFAAVQSAPVFLNHRLIERDIRPVSLADGFGLLSQDAGKHQ